MDINEIKVKTAVTLQSLKLTTDELATKIEQYLNAFRQTDFFTLDNEDEKREYYKKQYTDFTQQIISLTENAQSNANEIVSLMLLADMAMDAELSVVLEALFTSFQTIEKELYIHTKSAEAELSKAPFSVTRLMSSAKRLLTSFTDFSNKISKAEI